MATGGIGQGLDDAHAQLGRAGDRRVLGFARLHLDDGITSTTCLEGAPGLLEELLGLCAGPLTFREILLPQEALPLVLRLALLDLCHHGLEPLLRFGGAGVLGSAEVVPCLLYVFLGERLITELEQASPDRGDTLAHLGVAGVDAPQLLVGTERFLEPTRGALLDGLGDECADLLLAFELLPLPLAPSELALDRSEPINDLGRPLNALGLFKELALVFEAAAVSRLGGQLREARPDRRIPAKASELPGERSKMRR